MNSRFCLVRALIRRWGRYSSEASIRSMPFFLGPTADLLGHLLVQSPPCFSALHGGGLAEGRSVPGIQKAGDQAHYPLGGVVAGLLGVPDDLIGDTPAYQVKYDVVSLPGSPGR